MHLIIATVARRVVKTKHGPNEYEAAHHPGDGPALESFGDPSSDDFERHFCCYRVGDLLWVRGKR